MDNIRQQKGYFDIIQVFRGIAALMIIIHHSYTSIAYYQHTSSPFWGFLAATGKFGVDFFFILSGFIIAYSNFNKSSIKQGMIYYRHRLLRIYVPYIPISVAMLVLYYSFPSYSNGNRHISNLTSLTLIPNGAPALSVAWTLVYEMLFYTLFFISFISKKAWHWFLLIWTLAILFSLRMPNAGESVQTFTGVILNKYNLEFISGYLLCLVIRANIKLNKYFVFLLTAIVFGIFLYLKYQGIYLFYFFQNAVFALVCLLLIYSSITYFNIKLRKRNLLMIVGNATFSIYLIHNPLQAFLTRFLSKHSAGLSIGFELVIVMIVCCIIGYFYSRIFEVYFMGMIKKKLDK